MECIFQSGGKKARKDKDTSPSAHSSMFYIQFFVFIISLTRVYFCGFIERCMANKTHIFKPCNLTDSYTRRRIGGCREMGLIPSCSDSACVLECLRSKCTAQNP